jgi:hypothetical protein
MTNDRARVIRRRPDVGAVQAAAVITAALAVLAAACGGAGSSATRESSSSPSAVAYSACMRSHGVPNYPDPDRSGSLPKPDAHQFGVSNSQLQAAQQACQHLLPNMVGALNAESVQECMQADHCPQNLVQQVLNEERRFAGCMRSHGVPNWPDPTIDSQGRPVFAISISKDGFNPYSAQVWARGNDCSHLMPGLPGLPAAVSP